MQIVSANQLGQVLAGKGVILDVRTDMEYAEKRLSCAHEHVPLDSLKPSEFMKKPGMSDHTGLYILCRSGKRAAKAAAMFDAAGCANVHVIDGGILACEKCGVGLEGHVATATCSRGPISLERQVRIAAGSLVAVGAVLGLTAHPIFTLVPLVVGCGLVFAGATDRCGLALLLTKAPWNVPDKTIQQ